jgi:hypothetical protein
LDHETFFFLFVHKFSFLPASVTSRG